MAQQSGEAIIRQNDSAERKGVEQNTGATKEVQAQLDSRIGSQSGGDKADLEAKLDGRKVGKEMLDKDPSAFAAGGNGRPNSDSMNKLLESAAGHRNNLAKHDEGINQVLEAFGSSHKVQSQQTKTGVESTHGKTANEFQVSVINRESGQVTAKSAPEVFDTVRSIRRNQ